MPTQCHRFRFEWCFTVMLWCGAFSLGTFAAWGQTNRPNVVMICINQLGFEDLGCYGASGTDTPNIDALSKKGVLFSDFYAAATVTEAAQFSLMTGRPVPTQGGADVESIAASVQNLARLFKDGGYRTGAIGRWGLQAPGLAQPNQAGFDEWLGFLTASSHPKLLWRNQGQLDLADSTESLAADESHELLSRSAYNFMVMNRTRSFFLYLALTLPKALVESEDETSHADRMKQVDDTIGLLTGFLAKAKLDERTVVMITSDNGRTADAFRETRPEFKASHEWGKELLSENRLKIPLIVVWPNQFPAGRRLTIPCTQLDILPTLAELIGFEVSSDAPGESLLPVLARTDGDLDKRSLIWTRPNATGVDVAIRFGEWKALRLQSNLDWKLYNLETDPQEQRDVAGSHRWTLWRLKRKLPSSLR